MDDLTQQLEKLYISSYKLTDRLDVELDVDSLVDNLNNFHISKQVKEEELDELIENINDMHISPDYKLGDTYDIQVENINGQIKIKIMPKCAIEFMKENPLIVPRYINAF
jgi:methyl coenzyme M reductase subunit C-like uncharacterized protein (methanogenesis marker protein 7)